MRLWELRKVLPGTLALLAAITGTACQQSQQTVTNTNTATTTTSVNSAAPANVTVTTQTTTTGNVIETREPDKYSATMTITASTSGQQQQAPPFTVDVARNGADRYYALNFPAPIGRIIYLDKADKRYIVLPGSKQYAELTPEVTGVEVPRSLTPGQIISQIERQQGVERVGEETLNNRPAIKYRYTGKANTGTQAGQVATESYIFVDRDTGLPLRIEGFGQTTGNVQGVNAGRAVIEMTNLKTDVDAAQFEVPQGYSKITPEQLRQQTAQLASIIQGLMSFVNAQQGGAGAGAGSAPAASPSPAATR